MEGLGGFTPFTANEEVATALILLCALFSYKSEVDSHLGFRFQPTNEQIFQLLQKKRLDPHFSHRPIKDIDDICSLEPWDLPRKSDTELEEQVWYLFCEPYYKYKESNLTHRRTNAGSWKVTGRGSKLKTRNGLTGSKKILTFYRHGPDSKKAKTEWVMHEFHLTNNASYKVMDLTNMWACQDETLPNGTGQTLTPDFNSLKSAGGTYEDSSDKNLNLGHMVK